MRDAITPERVANQIRMRRSAYSGTFIIVEGHTDKVFYDRFVDCKHCEFSIAINKDNAIRALDILEKDNFPGVLAVVDADFSKIEVSLLSSPNLLMTDDHDLETMLIKSPALEKVLRERGSEEKIANFRQDIRKTLLEGGKVVGYLRWLSLKENLSLKFEGLTFSKFVDDKTLVVDLLKLIQAVKNHSQKLALKEKDIQDKLKSLKNDCHDPCHVSCGHDLICILSLGLCKALGSFNYKEVQPDVIERELRLAYENSYFYETQLYVAIQDWEANNQPFKVLLVKP